MASRIKPDGKTGRMLSAMAKRGGNMTCDYRGFPPSKVMLPLRRRGLVALNRQGLRTCRYNIWSLTKEGWQATGMNPPVE